MNLDPHGGGKLTLQFGDLEPQAPPSPAVPPEADASLSLPERIHAWSTDLAPWQRDLLRRLAHGPLSQDDERAVLKILLETEDAPTPRPLELTDLPIDEATIGPVELREVRDVRNVNLLAEGRTLSFKPGLNVVFGATGAGKSGYGRVLRRLCQPAERVKVLRNAFDDNSKRLRQSAVVRLSVGGEEREITVNLAAKPERVLSAMSVFDAACAPVYVSKPNVIEHVPGPFLFLRRMAEAQEVLRSRLKEWIATMESELPLQEVDPVTAVGHLVASITAETDPAEVERLATLSPEEQAEMQRLDTALAAVGSDQSRQLEAAARARARAAGKVADRLERAAEKLADGQVNAIADLRTRLDDATVAERSLAAKAFSGQLFPSTGQGLWRDMWEAARHFVEAEGRVFPSGQADAACPLCQQALEDEARARVAKLEEFVRSDLRETIATLTRDLSAVLKDVPDVAAIRALVEVSLLEAPERVSLSATRMVDALSARAELVRRFGEGSTSLLGPTPELPSITSIRAYAREQVAMAENQAGLRDEEAQQRLTARRAGLKAREELGAVLPKFLERIAGLVRIAECKKAWDQLNTVRISAWLRKLQEDVVTDRLGAAIVAELKAVDLLAGDIDVRGRARGGRTAIEFGLKGAGRRAHVGDILSDGEQRALALAFFLAESLVSGGRSAIILDDPAALLDFERREHVAQRLVEVAQRRQVIVFTHDLAFVQMLQQEATAAGQELHSQALQRRLGRAGMPGDDHLSTTADPAPSGPPGPTSGAAEPAEELSEPTGA